MTRARARIAQSYAPFLASAGYVDGCDDGGLLPGYTDDPANEKDRVATPGKRASQAQAHACRDARDERATNYPLEVGATVRSGSTEGVVKQIMPNGRAVEVQPVADGRYVLWATAGLVVIAQAKK